MIDFHSYTTVFWDTKMAFKERKGPRVKKLGRWKEVTVTLVAVFGVVIVSEIISATVRQRII